MTALEALELPLGTQFNVYDCDNNFVAIVASKEISEIGNNDVILYNIEKGNEIKLVRSLNDYDFRKHKEPISFNEILETQTNVFSVDISHLTNKNLFGIDKYYSMNKFLRILTANFTDIDIVRIFNNGKFYNE